MYITVTRSTAAADLPKNYLLDKTPCLRNSLFISKLFLVILLFSKGKKNQTNKHVILTTSFISTFYTIHNNTFTMSCYEPELRTRSTLSMCYMLIIH